MLANLISRMESTPKSPFCPDMVPFRMKYLAYSKGLIKVNSLVLHAFENKNKALLLETLLIAGLKNKI